MFWLGAAGATYLLLAKLGKRIWVICFTARLMRLILLGGLPGDLRFDFVLIWGNDFGLLSRAAQLAQRSTFLLVLMFDTWSHRGHSTLASVPLRPSHVDSHSIPFNIFVAMEKVKLLCLIEPRVYAVLTCHQPVRIQPIMISIILYYYKQ